MKYLVDETLGGRYKILYELGRGGLAVVYCAEDLVLHRNVALKMILPADQQSEPFLRRFRREARVLAKLSHPNIVRVLDFGEYESAPYLVMEYIPGGTLTKCMEEPLPYRQAVRLLLPVARALYHAHLHKVVHRDIKPANILLDETGQPMLADFGIVKLTGGEESISLTGTGTIIGTPSYMAPEQIQGGVIDQRTDVYALGIVFYEMITGRKPYVANTPIEITLKHLNDPVPHPRYLVRDLPQEAEQVIMKAMAKRPENRYQDMEAFAAALEGLVDGKKSYLSRGGKTEPLPKEDKSDTTAEMTRPNLRRRRLLPVFVGGGVLILLAGYYGLASTVHFWPFSVAAPAPSATPPPVFTATQAPNTPTTTLLPNTATALPTATGTPSPSATPTLVPTATPNPRILAPENISRVIRVNFLEKISVKDIAWITDAEGKASWIVAGGTGVINLIDPETLDIVLDYKISLNPREYPNAVVAASRDSLLYALFGREVRVYDLSQPDLRKLLTTFTVSDTPASMAIDPDGASLALPLGSRDMLRISTDLGGSLPSIHKNPGGNDVEFSPNGNLVAVATNKGVQVWSLGKNDAAAIVAFEPTLTQGELVTAVTFSHDGKYMASGSNDLIRLWAVDDNMVRDAGKLKCSQCREIKSLAFSPDDRLIAFGSADGKVRFWDVATGQEVFTTPAQASPVIKVIFSPEGDFLLSATEGLIQEWGLP